MMILFSIIIPAYNVEKYIENTLKSVYANNLEQTEIIVVDDGSTDSTWAKVNECLDTYQLQQCKRIRQENKGVSVARNVGIENAKGKYLIFCDGDDLCKSNLISTLMQYVNEDWDMLVWRYDITQGDKTSISQKRFSHDIIENNNVFKTFLLGENRIRLGSFAVKNELVQKNNLRYTIGCALSQDVEFIFKCLANTVSIKTLNDILFTYAKREGSVMYKYNMNRFEAPRVVKRIADYVRLNTLLFEDAEISDYLQNGFLIQHAMFAFDSCITYLTESKVNKFYDEYMEIYGDVESEIKRACKNMKQYPRILPHKRVRIFCLSRKIYIRLMIIYNMIKNR